MLSLISINIVLIISSIYSFGYACLLPTGFLWNNSKDRDIYISPWALNGYNITLPNKFSYNVISIVLQNKFHTLIHLKFCSLVALILKPRHKCLSAYISDVNLCRVTEGEDMLSPGCLQTYKAITSGLREPGNRATVWLDSATKNVIMSVKLVLIRLVRYRKR